MRRLIPCLCLLALCVLVGPVVVYGAGDASAIRRATHTSDSRYVSNYRPGTMQTSSRQRTSRAYSARPAATVGCRGRR